jgi:hypothetical protein
MLVSDDRPGYSVHELTKLYARRMTVEELFRDAKNRRYGWGARYHSWRPISGSLVPTGWSAATDALQLNAGRLDRLLLILALAYWILLAFTLVALQRYLPGMWCSSN